MRRKIKRSIFLLLPLYVIFKQRDRKKIDTSYLLNGFSNKKSDSMSPISKTRFLLSKTLLERLVTQCSPGQERRLSACE